MAQKAATFGIILLLRVTGVTRYAALRSSDFPPPRLVLQSKTARATIRPAQILKERLFAYGLICQSVRSLILGTVDMPYLVLLESRQKMQDLLVQRL